MYIINKEIMIDCHVLLSFKIMILLMSLVKLQKVLVSEIIAVFYLMLLKNHYLIALVEMLMRILTFLIDMLINFRKIRANLLEEDNGTTKMCRNINYLQLKNTTFLNGAEGS